MLQRVTFSIVSLWAAGENLEWEVCLPAALLDGSWRKQLQPGALICKGCEVLEWLRSALACEMFHPSHTVFNAV